MTTMRPRRSHRLRIAITVAMAMLVAGCGSSPEAGPTEPASKVDAGTTTPNPRPSLASPGRLGSLAYGVDGDIYVAEWDGSNPVRIADSGSANECGGRGWYWGEGPIWSPDGRYLAYRRDCDGPEDAWRQVVISDPEGNVVAEFPGEGWQISWSPDSTRVAVWTTVFETIGVFGVDGERQALLTMPPGWRPAGEHDPGWFPRAYRPRCCAPRPDGESLLVDGVVVPVDGSTPYKAPSTRGTYSPDGSRVAYRTRRSLVVAEADGSSPQVVFDNRAWNPVWSRTGDRIAFTTRKRGSGGVQLRVLDVATGTVRLLAEAGGWDQLEAIDFSPEGDRVLFARMEDGDRIGVGSLGSVNADGSDAPRRLVAATSWGDWLSPGPTP